MDSSVAMTPGTAEKAGIVRPVRFLCLTPTQSPSYPKGPRSPELAPAAVPAAVPSTLCVSPILSASPASTTGTSTPASSVVNATAAATPHRASSSASIGDKKRFLKLGPVFWGGIPGEDDYAVED